MAENLDERQETNDERIDNSAQSPEQAKFEQDVLNAAQEAMNSTESAESKSDESDAGASAEPSAEAENAAEEKQESPVDDAAKEADAKKCRNWFS